MDIRRRLLNSNLTEDFNCAAGDIVYYDENSIKTCTLNDWNESLGTPVGVVVIPPNMLPDNKIRIISLKSIDSKGDVSNNSDTQGNWQVLSLGEDYTNTPLEAYNRIIIINSDGTYRGNSTTGRLPSDNFTGIQSPEDSKSKYFYDNSLFLIPSPYLENDEINQLYNDEIDSNDDDLRNMLSDYNGTYNTHTLVSLGSNYISANLAWNYYDGISNFQWYIPAAGELGFLLVRLKTINETLAALNGVLIHQDRTYMSSTECYATSICSIDFGTGEVTRINKDSSYYMRPFAII